MEVPYVLRVSIDRGCPHHWSFQLVSAIVPSGKAQEIFGLVREHSPIDGADELGRARLGESVAASRLVNCRFSRPIL